jgi:formate dehydrogenase subunit gamma
MDEPQSLRDIAAKHAGEIGGLITTLREIVEVYGCIHGTHMETVADVFNLSVAEVRGVVSFYGDLRTKPTGNTHIRICQAEACQAVGARELTRATANKLGISIGETTVDGEVSLDSVYCLGVCTSGPNAMVNGRVIVRATVEALIP